MKDEKPEDSPIAEGNPGSEPEKKHTRRSMLAKLGLLGAAAYAAPVLTTLNDAQAASRSRSRSRSKSKNRKRRKKNRNRRKKNRRKNRSRSRSKSRSRSR